MTTTTTDDSIRDSGAGTLTALRTLAIGPTMSIADALAATEAQAQLLRDRLPPRADQLGVTDLINLVPGILVEYVDDMPVPSTSFWADGRWHIHIRASKPVDFQIVHGDAPAEAYYRSPGQAPGELVERCCMGGARQPLRKTRARY